MENRRNEDSENSDYAGYRLLVTGYFGEKEKLWGNFVKSLWNSAAQKCM